MTIVDNGGLQPGLYVVSTPIGNARDLSLRALDTLRSADILAAEDTRTLRRLMEIHGVPLAGRRIVAFHDHNAKSARPGLLAALAEGKSLAYASDAGTPLLADPGFTLVRAAREEGHHVTAVPGASALLSALTIAGLPTDRFLFEGFLPPKSGARRKILAMLSDIPATLVFYESPHRIDAMLSDLVSVLGGTRRAALCRELTKRFEEVREGTLQDLVASVQETPPRGELVVLVAPGDSPSVSDSEIDTLLTEALERLPVKQAANEVAARLGLARRDMYQRALALKDGVGTNEGT